MKLKENFKNLLYLLIRIALSFGLLFFLLHKFDFIKTWAVLKGMNLRYFVFVLLLTFLINFLLLLRWLALIRASGLNISFKKVTSAFSMGLFFNLFLPSSAGGDVARSIDLFGHSPEKSKIVASVILDRLSGFISIAIIFSISLFTGYKLVNDKSVLLIFGLVIFCLFAVLAILFSSTIFLKICRLFNRFKGIRNNLENLHRAIIVYRSKYRVIVANVFLSCFTQILSIAAFFLIAKSLHAEIKFIYFLIFIPLIFTVAMLPISIGGLGVRDSSLVYLFSKVGVNPNISLGISLINFALMVIMGLIGGVIYVCAFYSRRIQHHKSGKLPKIRLP